MSVSVKPATRQVFDVCSGQVDAIPLAKLQAWAEISEKVWVGEIDGEVACAWGVWRPSLLSEKGYLWLWCTPLVEENKFVFVRHSQRQIESLLEEFPLLVGFCFAADEKAIRWITWLGGEFEAADKGRVNFMIRKRADG